jgi:Divalent cation transporter
MSLKRRLSPVPPRSGVSPFSDEPNPKDGSTSLDPKRDSFRLELENKQLRLELEDVKRRLDRYEEDANRRSRRSSPRIVNCKRSPPPCLPNLLNQPDSQSSGRARPPIADLDVKEHVVPMGLHHRRQTGEDEDTRRIKKMVVKVKHRDSDDFDDVESPRPQHTAGTSGLQNDSYPEQNDADLAKFKGDDVDDANIGFGSMILDRAGWLVGLLVLQSMSSFIIQRNESMLQRHLVIVRFLTMLVGAGGNAGNQASVRGTCWCPRARTNVVQCCSSPLNHFFCSAIEPSAARDVLLNETAVGLCLSIILGMAGWIRAAAFATPFLETMAITASLFMIVLISVILGATLPLGMKWVGIDPAHSSTTIQVLMDILGVTITVCVSGLVLGSI